MPGAAMSSACTLSIECNAVHSPISNAETPDFVQDGIVYSFDWQLAPDLTELEYKRIYGILIQNLSSRRAQRVMGHYFAQQQGEEPHNASAVGQTDSPRAPHTGECWTQYQLRVIRTFQTEQTRYDTLDHGDAEAWETLARQLTYAAQRMMLHSGIGHLYAREQALEMSQQACEHIYAATYPWDISFDLWSHTIMRNAFLQRYTRSHDLMDREILKGEPLELEDLYERAFLDPQSELCACPTTYCEPSNPDASELIEAIEQMQSRQRRAVILYTYYEELSDEEIAHVIGKSRNAVQTLRHRALRQLRTLLGLA